MKETFNLKNFPVNDKYAYGLILTLYDDYNFAERPSQGENTGTK